MQENSAERYCMHQECWGIRPYGRFKDLPQLHEAVALQIHYYNTERIHSALGMSPAAYAALLNQGQLERDKVLQKAGP
jgi:transposase InsO family protein